MSRAATTAVAFQFGSLADVPLIHGMTGRRTDVGLEGDAGHGRGTIPATIVANRTRFLNELGLDLSSLTMGVQAHSAQVAVVCASDKGRGRYPTFDGFPATDGLVTNAIGVTLGIIVADCVPILLYDPVRHAVGVVHAGWRGTVGQIAARAVDVMRTSYGTEPADLMVGIGPSIGGCCYEVGDEVISAWRDTAIPHAEDAVIGSGASYHLDLWSANRLVLAAAGVDPERIESCGICVRCQLERFFSYRAAKAGLASPGRMLMVAQLTDRSNT